MGSNEKAIERLVKMIEEQSTCLNPEIRNIANNFNAFSFEPNFTVFQAEKERKSFFMNTFNALQIFPDCDNFIISHEFGHALYQNINHCEVPNDFLDIIKRAREYSIKPGNKEKLKRFIEHISDVKNENRTEAEKGPVSDIISSIFQIQVICFKDDGIKHILPSSHKREYYYDEINKRINEDKVFDEQFANFYALTANGCVNEINKLRELFGNELIETMENQLKLISKRIEKGRTKTKQTDSSKDAIKTAIIGVTNGQVEQGKAYFDKPPQIVETEITKD